MRPDTQRLIANALREIPELLLGRKQNIPNHARNISLLKYIRRGPVVKERLKRLETFIETIERFQKKDQLPGLDDVLERARNRQKLFLLGKGRKDIFAQELTKAVAEAYEDLTGKKAGRRDSFKRLLDQVLKARGIGNRTTAKSQAEILQKSTR